LFLSCSIRSLSENAKVRPEGGLARANFTRRAEQIARSRGYAETSVVLVEHTDVLVEKLDDEEIRGDLLPLVVFSTLESSSATGQEAALNSFSVLQDHIDNATLRKLILPQGKECFPAELKSDDIYKRMLTDKKFGLTYNVIATKVLPHLIPYTVNPNLRRDDFRCVMETLNAMWSRLKLAELPDEAGRC
uniref:PDEase domain-containing protein n=1 Tax=Macrostomum lignano TaxID=282301 RepID=A0A1I8F1S4_9PLAT